MTIVLTLYRKDFFFLSYNAQGCSCLRSIIEDCCILRKRTSLLVQAYQDFVQCACCLIIADECCFDKLDIKFCLPLRVKLVFRSANQASDRNHVRHITGPQCSHSKWQAQLANSMNFLRDSAEKDEIKPKKYVLNSKLLDCLSMLVVKHQCL